MRLIPVLTHETQIAAFADAGAGGILVPVEGFAARSRRRFSIGEIRTITAAAHALGLSVHLRMNRMIHETDLTNLRSCLRDLSDIPFDRIVCFDLTVAIVAAPLNLTSRMVYQPGTLATNVYDPGFYARLGLRGLTLSPDIQITELEKIAKAANGIECSLVGHGYLPMLISKRNLLSAYIGNDVDSPSVKNDDSYDLSEEMRPNEHFPILEDEFGTHLFRSSALVSFAEFPILRDFLTDFYLETIFLPDAEVLLALQVYAGTIARITFEDQATHPYDSGFYYRSTASLKEEIG